MRDMCTTMYVVCTRLDTFQLCLAAMIFASHVACPIVSFCMEVLGAGYNMLGADVCHHLSPLIWNAEKPIQKLLSLTSTHSQSRVRKAASWASSTSALSEDSLTPCLSSGYLTRGKLGQSLLKTSIVLGLTSLTSTEIVHCGNMLNSYLNTSHCVTIFSLLEQPKRHEVLPGITLVLVIDVRSDCQHHYHRRHRYHHHHVHQHVHRPW